MESDMKLKFSDRIGATAPPKVLHINEMSIALRTSLWNYLLRTVLTLDRYDREAKENISTICELFLKQPVDGLPYRGYDRILWLKHIFFDDNFMWYDVYNLIELIAKKIAPYDKFKLEINKILEEEMSGYRFIFGELTPITSPAEIESIASGIELSKANQLFGTGKHLETAITLLSQKPKPDYRNSIKESISAVESLVKQLTGVEGGGLDKAIGKLEAKVKFHGAFKAGLLSLYGYTSDAHGIRHAILEEPHVGFDEAKFMLVSCSALVNFLIYKAGSCGILGITLNNTPSPE